MIPYQKEKLDNAICFFALEHKKKSGKNLVQTYLYKYLAFVDFFSVEKTGVPAFGLEYTAMKRGPVPCDIYNKRHYLKTVLYEFKKKPGDIYVILPKQNPNLDYFSAFELVIMSRLIERYATKYSTTDEISEYSHKRILAWKRTYEKKVNGKIDYALTFRPESTSAPVGAQSIAEENYQIFSTLKAKGECR